MKYMVIVSQYYYSRRCFVVKPEAETFYEKSKSLIEDLEAYKRDPEELKREFNYGDFCEKYYHGIDKRNNVNDAGDIYFIPAISIDEIVKIVKENFEEEFEQKKIHKKKIVAEAVENHHSWSKLNKVILKYFEII